MIYPTAAELQRAGRYLHGIPAERLAKSYVIEPSGCWRWTGRLASNGYGHFSIRNVEYQAHRLTYTWLIGAIPAGLQLDHRCRNPRCVNPAHLEAVTGAENVRRGRSTRLTWTDVVDIRRRHLAGEGIRPLGRAFGVNHGHIHRIVNGQNWRHSRRA